MTNDHNDSLEIALKHYLKKSRLGSIVRAALIASFLLFIFNICYQINTLTYYGSILIIGIFLKIYFRQRHKRQVRRQAILIPIENVSIFEDSMTILTNDTPIEFQLQSCLMIQRDKFLYIKPLINIEGIRIPKVFFIIELPNDEQRLYFKSLMRIHQRRVRVVAFWMVAIWTLLIFYFLLSKLDLYYLQKLAYFITSHGKI